MKKICVFCGSRLGSSVRYREATREFGAALAQAGIGLVYGGGRVGLMGALADAVLSGGGYVTGIIPSFLATSEITHPDLQTCHTVTDLFERKSMMLEIADAFVALPGGIGTLDELLEVVAWRQLRQLDKPIGLLDVDKFFSPWLAALRHSVEHGFADTREIEQLVVASDSAMLLARLLAVEKR